jgi:hypothetical protein
LSRETLRGGFAEERAFGSHCLEERAEGVTLLVPIVDAQLHKVCDPIEIVTVQFAAFLRSLEG